MQAINLLCSPWPCFEPLCKYLFRAKTMNSSSASQHKSSPYDEIAFLKDVLELHAPSEEICNSIHDPFQKRHGIAHHFSVVLSRCNDHVLALQQGGGGDPGPGKELESTRYDVKKGCAFSTVKSEKVICRDDNSISDASAKPPSPLIEKLSEIPFIRRMGSLRCAVGGVQCALTIDLSKLTKTESVRHVQNIANQRKFPEKHIRAVAKDRTKLRLQESDKKLVSAACGVRAAKIEEMFYQQQLKAAR